MTNEVNEMSAASRGSGANYSAFPNSWIPVAEQRPPDCQAVLAYDPRVPADDAIAMLSFNVSSGEWSCPCARESDPAYDYEPTHWMPLPAPPTDGK